MPANDKTMCRRGCAGHIFRHRGARFRVATGQAARQLSRQRTWARPSASCYCARIHRLKHGNARAIRLTSWCDQPRGGHSQGHDSRRAGKRASVSNSGPRASNPHLHCCARTSLAWTATAGHPAARPVRDVGRRAAIAKTTLYTMPAPGSEEHSRIAPAQPLYGRPPAPVKRAPDFAIGVAAPKVRSALACLWPTCAQSAGIHGWNGT